MENISNMEEITVIEAVSDLDTNVRNNIVTNDITLSCNTSTDNSMESLAENDSDQFENILYQVHQNDSKTVINFNSRPIFDNFIDKMKADFALTASDNLSFTTHVNSLKCKVSVDKHVTMIIATCDRHI